MSRIAFANWFERLLRMYVATLLALAVLPPLCTRLGYEAQAGIVMSALAGLCHQLASRSLHLFGEPLGLCTRCTGIYLGVLLGLALIRARPGHQLLSRLGRPAAALGAAALLFVDWNAGHALESAPAHAWTLLTGVIFGLALAAGPYCWFLARVCRIRYQEVARTSMRSFEMERERRRMACQPKPRV